MRYYLNASALVKRFKPERGQKSVKKIIKDEVALWLSRYKRSKLLDFLDSIASYTSLTIESPSFDDEVEAEYRFGSLPLGYLDCVNLTIMARTKTDTIYTSDTGFDRVPGVHRMLEELTAHPDFHGFQSWARENL